MKKVKSPLKDAESLSPDASPIAGRQRPADVPEVEFASALDTIETLFKPRWLADPASDGFRRQWRTMDHMTSCQLYWLGTSLAIMDRIDRPWTLDQVNTMKTRDRNERIGAVFEILFLAMLGAGGHAVRPTKRKAAGFDARLAFDDGTALAVSLKNFATSRFEDDFDVAARRVYGRFVERVAAFGFAWAGFGAFTSRYPRSADWSQLETFVVSWNLDRASLPTAPLGIWQLSPAAPPSSVAAALNPGQRSHSFHVVAPHHPNERLNLQTKLEEAFANCEKHAVAEPNRRNAVVVRLGESAAIEPAAERVREYMKRVDGRLDEVLLYQPAIAMGPTGAISLVHHVTPIVRSGVTHPPFNLVASVGLASNSPPYFRLHAGSRVLRLDEHHVFQRGELFYIVDMRLGEPSAFLPELGPGITGHPCLRMNGDDLGFLSPSPSVELAFVAPQRVIRAASNPLRHERAIFRAASRASFPRSAPVGEPEPSLVRCRAS